MLLRALSRPLRRALFWGKAESKEATPPVPAASKEVHLSTQAESQSVAQASATDQLKYTILGNETHAAQIDLAPGQSVRAEAGSLAYMSSGVEMDTNLVGGIGASFKRILAGSSLMLTDFTYKGSEGSGRVVFSPEHPSKVIPLRLADHSGTIICAKDSYLCSEPQLTLEVAFVQKMSFGFFGGEGFVLQKITGDGLVLLKGGGVVIEKTLEADEEIRVSTGNLMAMETTVAYDLQVISGFKNVIFGGEGLFLTTLKGPGRVYLQSMPFSRIVSTVLHHIPHK